MPNRGRRLKIDFAWYPGEDYGSSSFEWYREPGYLTIGIYCLSIMVEWKDEGRIT